jgi:predicted glutamine amidotransferase
MPDKEFLTRVWSKNSDGGGFMYQREKSDMVHMAKGFMKLSDFIKAIKSQQFKKQDLVCIHLRKTTSGKTNAANCHPFVIHAESHISNIIRCDSPKHLFMMHNGTICDMEDGNVCSDTQHFARKMMPKINMASLYNSTVMQALIEKYIDESRLCFLHSKRGLLLLGEWHDYKGLKLSKSASLFNTQRTASSWDRPYYGRQEQPELFYKDDPIAAVNAIDNYDQCSYCSQSFFKEEMQYSRFNNCYICNTCVEDYQLGGHFDFVEDNPNFNFD